MRIQVLYFQGCPNHRPAVELVRTSGESYTFSSDSPGDSPGLAIQSGDVIKVGKRRFLRLI